jgi:hypothetical protein
LFDKQLLQRLMHEKHLCNGFTEEHPATDEQDNASSSCQHGENCSENDTSERKKIGSTPGYLPQPEKREENTAIKPFHSPARQPDSFG